MTDPRPMPAWLPRSVHRLALRRLQPVRLAWWGLRRARVRGIMVIATSANGRILLVRHSYHLPDQWLLPGGGLARGEDPIRTATRELAEEAGCRLMAPVHVATLSHRMTGGWTNTIDVVAGTFAGQPHCDGREIDEVGLFALDDLPPTTNQRTRAQIAAWQEWRTRQATQGL